MVAPSSELWFIATLQPSDIVSAGFIFIIKLCVYYYTDTASGVLLLLINIL